MEAYLLSLNTDYGEVIRVIDRVCITSSKQINKAIANAKVPERDIEAYKRAAHKAFQFFSADEGHCQVVCTKIKIYLE